MSDTIERLHIVVAGVTYALAPLEHVDPLKDGITAAVRAGGGFVDVALDDGHRLSILVTPASVITIAAETVRLDADRADGERRNWGYGATVVYDGDAPYDADTPYDLI